MVKQDYSPTHLLYILPNKTKQNIVFATKAYDFLPEYLQIKQYRN